MTDQTATPDAPPASVAPLSPGDVSVIIIGLMVVMLLAALDQTIVSTALPTIGRQLGNIEALPWVVTSYLLSSTVVTPLYGKLADIIGRRSTLLIAISVFLVGSAACGLSNSMLMLILARGVQGLGGGGLMSLVQTVISDIVTPKDRAKLQGYFAGVFMLAGFSGPVVGGIVAERYHWPAIFWINIPIGLLALLVVFRALLKLPRYEQPHKLDLVGAALMAIAAIALLLGLNTRGAEIMGMPVWGAYVVSAVFWILFALRLRLAAEPLIPTDILKNPIVMRAILISTLAMGAMIGMGIYNPLYLQLVYHLSAAQAGACLSPLGIGIILGSILSGRAMSANKGVKYKAIPMMGLLFGTGVYAVLAAFPNRLPLWGFEVMVGLGNAGIGSMFPVSMAVMQNVVERHQMGTATGVMNFFRSLGGALLVAGFGAVLFGELSVLVGHSAEAGAITPAVLDALSHRPDAALMYRPVFAMGSVALLLSFLVLWSLEEVPIKSRAVPTPAQAAEEASGEVLEGADFSSKPKS